MTEDTAPAAPVCVPGTAQAGGRLWEVFVWLRFPATPADGSVCSLWPPTGQERLSGCQQATGSLRRRWPGGPGCTSTSRIIPCGDGHTGTSHYPGVESDAAPARASGTEQKIIKQLCVSRPFVTSSYDKLPGGAIRQGTPGRIRTCDLGIRNPLLYPAELRGQSIDRKTHNLLP